MDLARAFASRLADPERVRSIDAASPGALEAQLASALAQARAAWPGVSCDPEAFAAFLGARVGGEGTLQEALASMPAADLYLACACASGEPRAIAAFEQHHLGTVDAVLARMRTPGVTADDVKQMLREKLFVGTPDAPPRIAEYAGKGALGAWLRVTATRLVLNLVRGPKDVLVDDERLLEAPGGALDEELEVLKRRYRAEFREAFAATLARLDTRDRALLRYTVAEGLGTDAIALVYGVHRTTVNRWLTDLRRTLAKGVRAEMAGRLGVSRDELESIMRLIESRIEITLSGAAGATG